MSAFLPAPLTIVVFSFSIITFLARPSMSSVTFSSLMPRSSRDRLAAGQDRDVLQHGLAAIAEARRLHGRDLEAAAQLVDDERGERLALDVLGDDEQRLAGLHHRFEQRQQLLQARELLLVDQDVGVVHLDAHLVGVGDEVGRDVAAVELHALDDVELGLEASWPLRP